MNYLGELDERTQTIVRLMLAREAEASVRASNGSADPLLDAQAGIAAAQLVRELPKGAVVAAYAVRVLSSSAQTLLTSANWRIGMALGLEALDAFDSSDAAREQLRAALAEANDSLADLPGRELGNDSNEIWMRDGSRLIFNRDDSEPDSWPLLTLKYQVLPGTDDPGEALTRAEWALERTAEVPFGKLYLTPRGTMMYQVDFTEDPGAHGALPELRLLCVVVSQEGLRLSRAAEQNV